MKKDTLLETSTISYKVFFWLGLLVIGFFVFFPLYWMIITSFKHSAEAFNINPSFFPENFTLENYINVFFDESIRRYLFNSLYVSIVSSFTATSLSIYAGYSFSKYRYTGRKSLMYLILSAQMFPFAVLLLTIYQMMQWFHLLDSYLALILSFITFTLPVGTWTMKSYFDQISDSLIEAATIDGAGRMQIIHRIMFPLVIPGAISTTIYGFVWSWNNLLYSLTLVTSPEKRTLAPGLVLNYLGEFQNSWTEMMAASIWVSIPVVIMFIFVQRFFIQGLTAGSVKG